MASWITFTVFYQYGVPDFSTNIEAMNLKEKSLNGKHWVGLKNQLWKTVEINTDPNFLGLPVRLNVAESIKNRDLNLKPHLRIFMRKDAAIKTHREEHPSVYKRGRRENFKRE